jgi:hypothetical protein
MRSAGSAAGEQVDQPRGIGRSLMPRPPLAERVGAPRTRAERAPAELPGDPDGDDVVVVVALLGLGPAVVVVGERRELVDRRRVVERQRRRSGAPPRAGRSRTGRRRRSS